MIKIGVWGGQAAEGTLAAADAGGAMCGLQVLGSLQPAGVVVRTMN